MKVAVSFLKSDNYVNCIKRINKSKADFIHVDVCDGKYVEGKNFTPKLLNKTLKVAKKKLDVHLMVNNPIDYINEILYYDIETITVHLSIPNLKESINYINSLGLKVGIAINPKQDIRMIDNYLDVVDQILIMSVNPGKGGQSFIPKVLDKIDYLNKIKNKYHFTISVDGGINDESISYLKDKNIDLIVSGSFITSSDDFNKQIKILKDGI